MESPWLNPDGGAKDMADEYKLVGSKIPKIPALEPKPI